MKTEKAIEILTILESRSINHSRMFKKDALKQGIKALKHTLSCPYFEYQAADEQPPGEAKD